MQETFEELLIRSISHERVDAYRQRGGVGNNLNLFAHYAWNIALCESLYPALQGLEIALRNAIHDAATNAYGTENWFDDARVIPHGREQDAVRKARETLAKDRKPDDAGRIVAELSFGFWTSLFDRRYEQILWPHLLKSVFPTMPRSIRTRQTLSKRLHPIRHLRNRVFHHEPIWYWGDLRKQHVELQETIGWINEGMLSFVRVLDRFVSVHEQATTPYERPLASLMEQKPA